MLVRIPQIISALKDAQWKVKTKISKYLESMGAWDNAKVFGQRNWKDGDIICGDGKSVGGTLRVRLAVHFGTC